MLPAISRKARHESCSTCTTSTLLLYKTGLNSDWCPAHNKTRPKHLDVIANGRHSSCRQCLHDKGHMDAFNHQALNQQNLRAVRFSHILQKIILIILIHFQWSQESKAANGFIDLAAAAVVECFNIGKAASQTVQWHANLLSIKMAESRSRRRLQRVQS